MPFSKGWERQPRESSEAWEAFQIYLSLGAQRSVLKVAKECTKSYSLLRRWSSKWNWVERVRARDNFLMAQEDKAQLLEARKRAINNGKLSDNLKAAVTKSFLAYIESDKPIPPSMWETLLSMAMLLEGSHADMFALSKYDQAELALQHGRLELKFARLEAAQAPPSAEGGGSNFIEALNANVAGFFPEYTITDEKEGKDEPVDKDDSEADN